MSNVYILEPPTSGKVLLKTTVGDIDVELWSKETPKTCRNFIQLCLEGYYNNTIFHRVVRNFIVQGGDPLADGTGGESIYGEPFKDEFHQRLRFGRRGLLAMANAGADDNGSQFFFTMGATPELQNKHTIFGKVVGDTVFNMLKLQEGIVHDETPEFPHKILKAEVLNNPFDDIEPRVQPEKEKSDKKKKKEKQPGVKNFKLLSFGEEAEEDEEISMKENEKFVGKGKSTHDVLDDPKLSSETAETSEPEKRKASDEEDEDNTEEQLENIRKKLKSSSKKAGPVKEEISEEKQKQMDDIKEKIKNVKKEYHQNKLKKEEEIKEAEDKKEAESSNELIKEYKNEYDKYKDKIKLLPKKGAGREEFTLNLLEKFKQKLHKAKGTNEDSDEEAEKEKPEEKPKEKPAPEDETMVDDESWMTSQLHFEDDAPVLAKDANTKDDDWFEIYDPRNPLNKRRRGEKSSSSKKK